jgi:hypothetical protein
MSSRYDGRVQDIVGNAVAGASIAVLTQPANITTQPGSPLATIFNAALQNTPAISTASWSNLTAQLTFVTTVAPPADIVAGSFVSAAGFTPTGYNGIWQVVSVTGNNVVVTTPFTLVAIVNPGTVSVVGTLTTSALPNPFFSDTLGNFFFYGTAGVFTVQIYDTLNRINPLVQADQNVVAGGGSGSVTSVALAMPAEFTVSGSPVVGSGTLTATKATELANTIWAGPTTGAATAPTFRALVAADLPGGSGTVSSVSHTLAVPGIFNSSVTGSPITTSGTLADTITLANENVNTVWAGPSSGAATLPTFRALTAQDFPFTLTALTSPQILALFTTPITLVPAPGVGFTIIPILIVIKLFGGGAAYLDGGGGAITFANGSMSAALGSNAIFLVTVSPNRRIQSFPWPGATDTAGNPPSDDNAALTIGKATGNFTAGTGTATVLCWYYTIATT